MYLSRSCTASNFSYWKVWLICHLGPPGGSDGNGCVGARSSSGGMHQVIAPCLTSTRQDAQRTIDLSLPLRKLRHIVSVAWLWWGRARRGERGREVLMRWTRDAACVWGAKGGRCGVVVVFWWLYTGAENPGKRRPKTFTCMTYYIKRDESVTT